MTVVQAGEDFVAALRGDDPGAVEAACRVLAEVAGHADVADLSVAAGLIGDALPGLPVGRAAMAAPLLGSLVSRGADPAALEPVALLAAGQLELAARFEGAWRATGPDAEPPEDEDEAEASYADLEDLPDTDDDDAFELAHQRLIAAVPEHVASLEEATRLTTAWFVVGRCVQGLLIPLQDKAVRRWLPYRARLTAAAQAAEEADCASWLLGLLLTLDDEPLVVLHRGTGRGYRLTMSGIGDNFQLHTLLAATLIGSTRRGMVPGTAPKRAWVSAATDGPIEPPGGIHGQFNLVDAHGAWIWNEGRPADIPVVDGARLVVLDPPPYARSWNAGRAYPHMTPTLTLDAILPVEEAAALLASVTPPAGLVGADGPGLMQVHLGSAHLRPTEK